MDWHSIQSLYLAPSVLELDLGFTVTLAKMKHLLKMNELINYVDLFLFMN